MTFGVCGAMIASMYAQYEESPSSFLTINLLTYIYIYIYIWLNSFPILTIANNCAVLLGTDCTNCVQCVSGYQFVSDESCQPPPSMHARFTPLSIIPSITYDICSSTAAVTVATDTNQRKIYAEKNRFQFKTRHKIAFLY